MFETRTNRFKMIVILRIAAGILLVGVVFWAINSAITWIGHSIRNYRISKNKPDPTQEQRRNKKIENKKKLKKLVIIYLSLCAALILIIISADMYF